MIRHHVKEHERRHRPVHDYMRGHGSRVRGYLGEYRPQGRLSYGERQRLPDKDFAVILKDGERKYPIYDKPHARNALARVSRFGSPHEKRQVCMKVAERFPDIHESNCKMHKDPIVVAEKQAATQEYAESEAQKLRSEG